MDPSRLLPLADDVVPERADAARNRTSLLAAAAELVEQSSVEEVTMAAVARRAGVGKGTVFRRFESREGLMAALLDHTEAAWQAAVLSGPPPLGPGAPARDRLVAFGHSRIETGLRHAGLIRAAGQAASRPYAAVSFSSVHVRHLLGEIGVTGDLTYLATCLLAPLEIPVLQQQVEHEGLTLDRIHHGWDDLLARVLRD